MFCMAFAVVLFVLPSSAAANTAPTPTPTATPTATPTPSPTPAKTTTSTTAATGTAATGFAPEPTPTPIVLEEPTPTPDEALQDQGSDEPSIDDELLKEETPVQDDSGPASESDQAFASQDYKETHSSTNDTYYKTDDPNAISYEYTTADSGRSPCLRTIKASVVAFDQVFFWNRLGAVQPQGMIFALRHNVVPIDWRRGLTPGNVRLRGDKRPRPLVLRMNVGDCLQIDFQNLLHPTPRDEEQPATRHASIHVVGLQLVNSIKDDGSNVGNNPNPPGGLVAPGGRTTYTLYADENMKEGVHLMYSAGATTTGEGDGGQIPPGLFGAVNVEPKGAEWYRSQLTRDEMLMATSGHTPGGQPIINYNAVYPWWHRYRGLPILKIMNKNRIIVHQDLNAIITGPDRGRFPAGTFKDIPVVAPNRDWPFREFTIVYHDEIGAVQAFPHFEEGHPDNLEFTLHGSRDAFAINYGTGGIGSEILANRLGVGPMKDCKECLFEEFFLSAWAVGDPAMIVDRPANSPCTVSALREGRCTDSLVNPPPGFKATKAFYPQDPSNVHHSYLGDHVKQRIVHAGPKEHHIHHLHAHQWLKAADGEGSSYNDSQALGPSSGHNLEITHSGSGNRNLTVGDSIFHCHFYPHFAQGMWELWRTHDVFEEGTRLDFAGRPSPGARALPDAEILRGTPIPAIVPIPGGSATNMAKYVMPPMPEATAQIVNGQVQVSGTGNPGFPFFVPARAGHRPPHPPLDTEFNAGLPRHIIFDAIVTVEEHTRTSFEKEIEQIRAQEILETGEPVEVAAMNYHAQATHNSYRTDGSAAKFLTNGRPPVAGAPYADPCVTDRFPTSGEPVLTVAQRGRPVTYKGVMFQFDMTINKAGWHFPQTRIESLWRDYDPIRLGQRAPEPLFFRANQEDCITFKHVNLIPKIYRVDDFQVTTPTDIVGQHIHLVKFDVTSSDGAGNGWNYEDGTFGPEEVRHRVDEINRVGGIYTPTGGRRLLTLQNHPFFGVPAQTTIQRWLVDDVGQSVAGNRTLRNAFTHDHFGPSTHQQGGLYAGLIIEPKNSEWYHNETGALLGGPTQVRDDGGPTTFQAVIITRPDDKYSYREFLLEFQDFQLAYLKGGGVDGNGLAVPDPERAVNPPGRNEIPLPPSFLGSGPFGPDTALLKRPAHGKCPDGEPAPCPEIIAADDPGTFSVNYRNEPIPLRVRDPNTNKQVLGTQGDLSHVYRSIARVDPVLNTVGPYPPITADVGAYDPFTPLLRAYENDSVEVRVLVGAHEEGHNFSINGIKWLFEPFDPDSGYRNSQMMGISEKYDFLVPRMPKNARTSDYLYKPGTAVDDQWNGLWGLMRTYSSARQDLVKLPNNKNGFGPGASNPGDFVGVCPRDAANNHARNYTVAAYLARDILPQRTLQFTGQNGYNFTVQDNNPHSPTYGNVETGPLHDPTAIIFVNITPQSAKGDPPPDIDPSTGMYSRPRVEPLVLRANSGDCINVTLVNRLPDKAPDLPGYNTMPMIVDYFNANQVIPSSHVGLHPQLVFYDVTKGDGMNVGNNPIQTAAPGGGTVTYQWYAGDINIDPVSNYGTGVPIEFGATNLSSSDPIKHSNKSAIGSLIIEPQYSTWAIDPDSTHSATIKLEGEFAYDCIRAPCYDTRPTFREQVLQFQNDINLRFGGSNISRTGTGNPVPNLAEAEDPEDSGQKAINYRTEPMWTRLCYYPSLPLTGGDPRSPQSGCPNPAESTHQIDITNVLHNVQIGGRDPVTPIFTAGTGSEVRFRVLHSGGHARNNVFMVHGHVWQEMPYQSGSKSTVIGFKNDSPWHGSQYGHGPSNHFDVVISSAGGRFNVTGDYLFRTFQSFQFDGGIWGLFRVEVPVINEQPPCGYCPPGQYCTDVVCLETN
ncbi:MAG: manganese oxidase [Pyrinomonadaceae bacterium]|nr:manganese oxidase [Pyrinomonadaceae bacterium]